jgi:group I intron endonuclease
MIIYKAVNKVNGKLYVGISSREPNRRISEHLYRANKGSKYPFHNAIRKYGIHSFEWFIVDVTEYREILLEKERYWVKILNSKVPNGYNLTDGGENNPIMYGENNPMFGKHHTEKTKKEISDSEKGKIDSEETRKKKSSSAKKRAVGRKRDKNGKFIKSIDIGE